MDAFRINTPDDGYSSKCHVYFVSIDENSFWMGRGYFPKHDGSKHLPRKSLVLLCRRQLAPNPAIEQFGLFAFATFFDCQMNTSSDFAWNRFDPESFEAFAQVFQYEGASTHEARSAWIGNRFKQPTNEFVSTAFHAIRNIWFRRNENVASGVVDAFIRNEYGPREKPHLHVERMRFPSQCPNRNVIRKHFQKAITKYGRSGSWNNRFS